MKRSFCGILGGLALLAATADAAEDAWLRPLEARVSDVGAMRVIGYHLETPEGCAITAMLDLQPVLREALGMPMLGATRIEVALDRGEDLVLAAESGDRLRLFCAPGGGLRVEEEFASERFAAR